MPSNNLIFAMDAIFGLPRKKSAGTSFRAPLHKELFFEDQSAVDQFIAEDSTRKSTIIVNVSLIHSFSDVIVITHAIIGM